MKKLFLLFQFILIFKVGAQTFPSFTVVCSQGYTITCSNPSLSLTAISDYTSSPVTYSWTGPGGPYTGSIIAVSNPGNYHVTAFTGTLSSNQTIFISANTTTPWSIGNPTFQTILSTQTTSPTFTITR